MGVSLLSPGVYQGTIQSTTFQKPYIPERGDIPEIHKQYYINCMISCMGKVYEKDKPRKCSKRLTGLSGMERMFCRDDT
jgi:hypothetical protein